MRTIGFFLLLGCALQISLEAQPVSQPASVQTNGLAVSANIVATHTNAPADRVAPTIVARSAYSRDWARIIRQTNGAGQVSLVTNKAYVELASGICFQTNGEWVDAQENITTTADGAAATQAGHTVHFAGNANTAAGAAVHLVAPDGKVFDSRVRELSYWDSASGQSVLLAQLQDSQGVMTSSNRVLYQNAFQGLKADIEYVFTKAGLEQNIIVREQPPAPDSFGLADASSRFQVWTEFFAPPVPQKKTRVVRGVAEDTFLAFGAMSIGMGKAFFTPGQDRAKAVNPGRVSKHWVDGTNHYLIEEIDYKAISNAVQNLGAGQDCYLFGFRLIFCLNMSSN